MLALVVALALAQVQVQQAGVDVGAPAPILDFAAGATCSASYRKVSCSITGGSGAPTTATYLTQTADATLTNEQALSSLSTGLMSVTTGTGVVGNYAGATCTNQFISALSGAGAATCTSPTLAGAQFANQGTTVTLLHGNAAGNPSWAAVSMVNDVTGTLGISNGGTNSTATATNGGVGYGTGTAHAYTAAGTSGQLLRSAGAASPTWGPGVTRLAVSGSNFTTTNATATTITGLSWSAANGTPYYFKCHLAATGSATGGPRVTVTSSGTSTVISYQIFSHTTAATTLAYTGGSVSGTLSATCTASCLTTDIPITVSGMVVPSAAVTLAIAAANGTAGQTTTVKIGSACIVWTP